MVYWTVAALFVSVKEGSKMEHTPIGPHDPGCLQCIELASSRTALLEALEKLVRRSDNGDTIEPGWYEIEEARATIEAAKGEE